MLAAAVVGAVLAGCSSSSTSTAGPASTGATATSDATDQPVGSAPAATGAPGAAPAIAPGPASTGAVLTTPCFTTGPGFTLPVGYVAADVSAARTCEFVLQAEGQADTTVIAGELYASSSGRTFEQFVALVETGLHQGQEPDILALQLLNTGPSGRDLPVLDRRQLSAPNRAVIITHESDRRSGLVAFSAVVDVPNPAGTPPTHAIVLWGLRTEENDQLIVDLIDSMQDVRPVAG